MTDNRLFDLEKLASAKPGMDDALAEIGVQMERYFNDPGGEAALLQSMHASLQRLLDTLSQLELEGAAVFCKELESALSELAADPQQISALYREVFNRALFGIKHYLDSLALGGNNSALSLFPQYQELQQLRGLEMSFELDLFYPRHDVQLPIQVMSLPLQADAISRLKMLRSQYQQGLLKWLRQDDIAASIKLMRQALDGVLRCIPQDGSRAFWWIGGGLLDCLEHGGLPAEMNVRKLLSRIDQHLRTVIDGKAGDVKAVVNEMLYLIGNSTSDSEQGEAIKRVYRLGQYLPQRSAISPDDADQRLNTLREQLRVAEECWEQCVLGDTDACEDFIKHAEQMASQSDQLNRDVLQYLTKQIYALSQYASSPEHAQPIAIDMAMALLLLDNGIEFYDRINNDFQKQAHILADRMHAAIKGLQEDKEQMAELVELHFLLEQQGEVMGSLASEMLVNLQQVEQGLNAYFENATRREELHKALRLLEQIHGGLKISALLQADQLLASIQEQVHRFNRRNEMPQQSEKLATAEAIGVLENYLQRLSHGQTADEARLEEVLLVTSKPAPAVMAEMTLVQPEQVGEEKLGRGTVAVEMAEKQQGIVPAAPAELPSAGRGRLSSEEQELLDIFLEEAREVLETIRAKLATCLTQPDNYDLIVAIRRGFHTLKGSGRMVGLTDLGEVAWSIERAMNKWLQDHKVATPGLLELIKVAEQSFDGWVQTLRKQGEVVIHADDLVAAAQQIENGLDVLPQTVALKQAVPEPVAALDMTGLEMAGVTPDLVAESAEVELPAGVAPSLEPTIAAEAVVVAPAHVPGEIPAEAEEAVLASQTLLDIASAEMKQCVAVLHQMLDELLKVAQPEMRYDFMRAAHTLAGVCRTMGFPAVEELAHTLEGWIQERMDRQFVLTEKQLQMLVQVINELDGMMQSINDKEVPLMRGDLLEQLRADRDNLGMPVVGGQPAVEQPAKEETPVPEMQAAAETATIHDAYAQLMSDMGKMSEAVRESAGKAVKMQPMEITLVKSIAARTDAEKPAVYDELDEQLLPVFIEEADELVPQIDERLRIWREDPGNEQEMQSVKRLLHTLKGSARMVGAMQIGEIAHEMEDRIAAVQHREQPSYWNVLEDDFDHITTMLEEIRSGKPSQNKRSQTGRRATDKAGTDGRREDRRAPDMGMERAVFGNMLRVRSEAVDRLVGEASEINVARSRMETELQVIKEGLQELTASVMRLRTQLREVEIQAETQIQARVSLVKETAGQFDPLELDRFTRFQELTRFMNESVHDVQTVQQTMLKNLEEVAAVLQGQGRLNRELQQGLMNIRMVSVNSIADRLYRVVRQTAKELNKRANLELSGTGVELDRSVLEKMIAPLEHLLRNSIVHGLENDQVRAQAGKLPIGEIRLSVRQENNEVVFEYSDDGAGLNYQKLREKGIANGLLQPDEEVGDDRLAQLIFVPGLSTAAEITEIAGRGVGMDVVRSEISALGGRIEVSSKRGEGTIFLIHLPLTLAFTQVLMVRSGEAIYAIPAIMVEQVRQVKPAELDEMYQVRQVEWQGMFYPLHYLPELLGDHDAIRKNQPRNPVLLLRAAGQRMALHVDELLGNQGVMVKNMGPQLARLSSIAGATVLGDGKVVLILNPEPLVQHASKVSKVEKAARSKPFNTAPLIMVVDDSLTVRKITSRMLLRAGYQVVTATDGVDALEKLEECMPDVILLDIEMPRMDGFALARELRRNSKTLELPIIMITSRTADKHRDYARQLGVNTYLGKPYQEDVLLQKIADFVAAHKLDTVQ